METPQNPSPYKKTYSFNLHAPGARAFLVFGSAFLLLLFYRIVATPFVGTDAARIEQFIQLIGNTILDIMLWVGLPYLAFLAIEFIVKRQRSRR